MGRIINNTCLDTSGWSFVIEGAAGNLVLNVVTTMTDLHAERHPTSSFCEYYTIIAARIAPRIMKTYEKI